MGWKGAHPLSYGGVDARNEEGEMGRSAPLDGVLQLVMMTVGSLGLLGTSFELSMSRIDLLNLAVEEIT